MQLQEIVSFAFFILRFYVVADYDVRNAIMILFVEKCLWGRVQKAFYMKKIIF